jgi:tetratricopeptide (TPR) repeat protein
MENLRASMVSRIRTAQTPAEELRHILTRLEGHVGQIGFGEKAAAAEILDLLDQAEALIKQISATGGDLAAENTRFNTITRQFDKKKAAFLKEIGGAEALQQLRATREREEDHWWWYADLRLAEERRLHRTHVLRRVGIATLVLTILTSLYMLFLAPDEATREHFRHEHAAEQALIAGNPAAALIEADMALSYAPDDEELLILKGMALELQGKTEQAQVLYDRAQVLLGETEAFLASRAQTYMLADRSDLALADAQHIVELDPDSALGHFILGNTNASLGNYYEAAANYERASELADAAGQTELQGLARIQLGNITMMMQAPDLGTDTQPSE